MRVEQLEREGLVGVTWLPFELHPEAPPEGIPRETYFGRERSQRIHTHLQSMAESVGLTMTPRDVIINSRRALGAAELAREHGRFDEMHHAPLKAHWGGGELRKAIATNRYDAVIDENRRVASSAGIDAIPAHIFGRRFLVLGAQPYEVLKQVVDRVSEPA